MQPYRLTCRFGRIESDLRFIDNPAKTNYGPSLYTPQGRRVHFFFMKELHRIGETIKSLAASMVPPSTKLAPLSTRQAETLERLEIRERNLVRIIHRRCTYEVMENTTIPRLICLTAEYLRMQSAFLEVLIYLEDKGYVDISAIRNPINMQKITQETCVEYRQITPLMNVLSCFSNLKVPGRNEAGHRDSRQWLATIIVRGAVTTNFSAILDRIKECGQLGTFDPTELIGVMPVAIRRNMDAGKIGFEGQQKFCFWLPGGMVSSFCPCLHSVPMELQELKNCCINRSTAMSGLGYPFAKYFRTLELSGVRFVAYANILKIGLETQ